MPLVNGVIEPSGPTIEIFIAVSGPRLAALQAAQISPPTPILVRGLIDTGASCSGVDPSVISGLGLSPTGTTHVYTPSTGQIPRVCRQYDVSLWLPSVAKIKHTLPVVETHIGHRGIEALIGRDVLSDCLFIYNGATGTFVLALE